MADYIERDKALDAVLQLPPKMDEQGYGWLGRMGVLHMLRDFPSADVAPVAHGKWIPSEDDSKVFGCSKCHEIVYGTPNYCPRCGAKMDA